MRFLRLGTVALLLGVTSCDSPLRPQINSNVLVRVQNNSSFSFARVDVVFPEDEVSYGSISAKNASDYRPVSKAYRYAYIEVEMGGQELVIQPIDYVGESLLRSGRYTYVLNVTIEGHLTLDFREDN